MCKQMVRSFLFEGFDCVLKSLWIHVLFGAPSGLPDPLEHSLVAEKSLFFTYPSMMLYTESQEDRLADSEELYSIVEKGVLQVHVNHKHPLSQVAQAHRDLKNRKTSGSIMLIPDNKLILPNAYPIQHKLGWVVYDCVLS